MSKSRRNNNRTAGSGSSSSAPLPPWIELPWDLTLNILRRLDQIEILESVDNVCTTWRNVVSRDPSLWRVIHMNYPDDTMFRRAVDRSQGQLIDVLMKHFGTDELLRYISDRSTHLERLTVESCNLISSQGVTTAIKNFPHLEELRLYFVASDFHVDVETIGVSCPLLKSFSLNRHYYQSLRLKISNMDALSIAKSMPNLCRLGLVGNRLSNEGVQALDGCPNLESLDLRRCFKVDLESEFGRMCRERIKELRCRPKSTEEDRYTHNDMNLIELN